MNDLTSCEHMSERVYVCVCVRVPDAWKACCVVNSTSLKHWAAGQQLVCDSFYWNYLFLITIESKFNLFHKPSVLQSLFSSGVYRSWNECTTATWFWKVFFFLLTKDSNNSLNKTANKSQSLRIHFHSFFFPIKITRSHFTKKQPLCNFDPECLLKPGLKLNTFTQVL